MSLGKVPEKVRLLQEGVDASGWSENRAQMQIGGFHRQLYFPLNGRLASASSMTPGHRLGSYYKVRTWVVCAAQIKLDRVQFVYREIAAIKRHASAPISSLVVMTCQLSPD